MAIALGCFFLALINAMAGVRNINKVYFDVAKNYGASKKQMFIKVMFPASLPMIFTGIRLALGMSLLVVVGLEFVSANKGIGAMIWYAWETFEIEKTLCRNIYLCDSGHHLHGGTQKGGGTHCSLGWSYGIHSC